MAWGQGGHGALRAGDPDQPWACPSTPTPLSCGSGPLCAPYWDFFLSEKSCPPPCLWLWASHLTSLSFRTGFREL